ncbi:MAG: hypothetical protein AB3N14_13010, partial [Flavobacteriaceae bacterium]
EHMDETKEKNLDSFMRKSVKELGLEAPSSEFTKKILAKIEVADQKNSMTAYTPLISRWGWGILVAIVGILSAVVLFNEGDAELAWLEKMNMGALPDLEFLDALPELAVSNTLFYSLLIFAFFAVLQVLVIKQRLDERYA